MTRQSITETKVTHEEISSIAQILEINLQYFLEHSSSAPDYFKELQTMVSLGFVAVSAVQDYYDVTAYQNYFRKFLDYLQFLDLYYCEQDTEQYEEVSLLSLYREIAMMMQLADGIFLSLGHSKYHKDFLASVKKVLDPITAEAGKKEEAKRLVSLFSRPSRFWWW